MKKILLLAAVILATITLNAQDIIVLRDASEIEAKVLEVTDAQISYKRFDNPNGPTYRKNTSEVFYVKYSNGTKEVFTTIKSVDATPQKVTEVPTKDTPKSTQNMDSLWAAKHNRPFIRQPMFDGYAEVDLDFGAYFGFGMDFSFGCRINDYLYAGIQLGAHYLFEYYDATRAMFILPFRFDCRAFFPINKNVHPYLNLTFGPGIGFGDGVWYTPSFTVGMGFDIKRFTFGIGYENFYRGMAPHYGFVKFGVGLGKR